MDQSTSRWGILGTLLLGCAIAVAHILISIVVTAIYIIVTAPNVNAINIEEKSKELETNGTLLALSTVVSLFCIGGLTLLFAKLKKGSNLKDYFGFKMIPIKSILLWLLALGGFILIADLITMSCGRPIVPDVMKKLASTSTEPILFYFAIIVAAPILEELFFRGFLFEGISSSSLGPIAAIFITSLLWSSIHLQYDLFVVAVIFFIGLFIGYAKYKTNSLYLVIIIHATNNFISSVELLLS